MQREELRNMWEGAHFDASFQHFEVLMKNTAAQGACSVFREIEALNFTEIVGETDNAKLARIEDGPVGDISGDGGY